MKKVLKAPAKINLCLRVLGKREDGYHNLRMIMQAISLFDTIEFEIVKSTDIDAFKFLRLPKLELPKIKLPDLPKLDFDFLKQFDNKKFDYSSENQVNLKCNYSYIPTDDKNLIVKCVKYLFSEYGIKDKIYIYLKKMIPTSGGLGGGSSDAAALINFINKYYRLKLSASELNSIAAKFGADIPFFIRKKESICEGVGEIITEIKPFHNYYILIATPNVRVSTSEIFSKFDKVVVSDERVEYEDIAFNDLLKAIKNKNIYDMSKCLFNDLELVTESMFSDVSIFKEKIKKYGALCSMMSGSGPTVFGIFNSYFKAVNCKKKLKSEYKDSFIFISRPI